jgi:hypothetical protein
LSGPFPSEILGNGLIELREATGEARLIGATVAFVTGAGWIELPSCWRGGVEVEARAGGVTEPEALLRC